MIYKLVETESHGEVHSTAKFSAAKVTYPGKKQVFRTAHAGGSFAEDTIGIADEVFPGSEALLVPVMENGTRTVPRTNLAAARKRCGEQIARLPEALRGLDTPPVPYMVRHSERLENLLGEVRRRLERSARI